MDSVQFFAIFFVSCALIGHSRGGLDPFTSGFSVVDLSHPLKDDTVYWPDNPSPLFTILHRGLTPQGFWYETNKFETAEHGGTHADAPSHFSEGNWRAHEIPAQRLVGPGVVVDVTAQVEADPDYRLGVSDLQTWEREHGPIPDGAVVMMMSGWSSRYPHKSKTFNSQDPTDPTTFHFPGFHPDALDWLVANRNISMIGVDTPSTDAAQTTTMEVHRKAAEARLIGLENVNTELLPPSGSLVFVGMTKIYEGSGGPARILALVSDINRPFCGCPVAANDPQGPDHPEL